MNIADFTQGNYPSKVFQKGNSLPVGFKELIFQGKIRDSISLLDHGKEWAYELLTVHQPHTAKQLLNGSEFSLILRENELAGYTSHVVQEVNGNIIGINRRFLGANPDDDGFSNRKYSSIDRYFSLPESIRLAYYHRFDGLNVINEPVIGPFTQILPFPINRPWESIDGYLNGLRLKKKLLPLIEEMIPGVKPDRKDSSYTKFMMFLNSWGSFTGKKRTDGDHLFVKNHIQDGVVYYIRDADVENMMVLADPAEAIDRYCEHVLLKKEERFDFRPWAVPM
ncbi:hypothetical protein [Ochrobactrum sp. BTU1]|uniref:hypothetical protein n=1 Tax=Ochrobactrum sp. BTU1 TaxID=2840456 RepID=UPI001C05D9B3|nr:hypothetical protein KMS41_26060 [Ochrobactrum sp. BTU1]